MKKYNLSNNVLTKSLIIDKKILKRLINLKHNIKGEEKMLDIDMRFKKGILIVRLKGILNKYTSKKLKNDLEIIKINGIKYVLLNLKGLSKIDKQGLETINDSYKDITNNKGKLILCGINKMLDNTITDNLYGVSEEVLAYDIVNI